MITKKHFKAVAAILKSAEDLAALQSSTKNTVRIFIGRHLEELYAAENSRFDRIIFEFAANLPANTGDKQ